MKTNHIVSTFTDGMNKDIHPNYTPDGSYLEAWNGVLDSDEHFVFGNESGNQEVEDFGGKVVGYMRVPDRDQTVVFVKSGSSDIYIFDHKTNEKTLVVSDSQYGCNWDFSQCETIFGEYKSMQPCNQLMVYFSSNCNYYVVNVDELLDPQRRQDLTCLDFNLFNCICGPVQTSYVLEGAGANLPAGAYQFTVQLEDKDGNTTNWFMIGEPTYLESENNIAGEPSPHGIVLALSKLDPRYNKVNVAVISTIGGATTSYLITNRTYSSDGITIEYTSTDQHKEVIPLEEILIKRKTYLQGKRLFQKDGRLFLYQIRQEANLNYQREANNIDTKYVVYKVPATEAWRFPSLMRDEVYAVGIVWKFCDGTYSPVFHVPNNVNKPSGDAESCTDCDVPIWLQKSTAVRTDVLCIDETQPDFDEVCFCPPNATCDENCNVIIGDEPDDDPEEKCIQFNYVFRAPPSCVSDLYATIYLLIDGEQVVINITEPFINGFVTGSQQINYFDNYSLTTMTISGLTNELGTCPIDEIIFEGTWTDCTDPLDGGEMQFSMGGSPPPPPATGGDPVQVCGPQGCSQGSYTCSGGSCSYTCTGGGCGGGSAGRGSFSGDIRPDVIHNKAYDKELCDDAQDYEADESTIIGCADCAADAATTDVPTFFKSCRNYLEKIRDLMRKDDEVLADPGLNTTSLLSDAVGIVCEAIEGLESLERKKATLTKRQSSGGIFASSITPDCEGEPIYSDDGCTIIGYNPALIAKGNMGYWESCELYPLDRDCDGVYVYGDLAGTPIRHHKTPDANTERTHVSRQMGVENFMELENYPYKETNVYVIGLELSNIVFPTDLPKPLCDTEPYKIVIAKREGNNKSVIAKGIINHTFKGNIYGKDHAVSKHGVNSFEYVDRYIENGTEENHLGEKWAKPIFSFHSPDTNTFDPFLNPDYFKSEYELYGTGFKYGNYANGKQSGKPNDSRLDRRGVRQAINLNRIRHVDDPDAYQCIDGITYAPANSIVKQAEGIDHPINNMYREKCIYFQSRGLFPTFTKEEIAGLGGIDPYIDYSFIGDGVDHHQMINIAVAHYGALKRYNKCQYGNIESLTYVGTPIIGTGATARGWAGDSYITQYSFKKSGYVSNKVGNILNQQFADIAGGRITRSDYLGVSPRTVCMPPNRRGANMEEHLGMYDHTKLPDTGDTRDPKNMASLHPTRRWNEVYNSRIVEPESDVFYPRVVTTLIHFWCESEINQRFRQSGTLDDEIFYGKLKGKDLDSEEPASKVADNGWLNNFHEETVRISKVQLATRAAIRTFINVALPAIFAGMVADTDSGLELGSTLATAPFFLILWLVVERFIGSNKNLNKLLGIKECNIDETGAEQDENIKGFKDNYHRYNLDYSMRNELNFFLGVPANYNTCICNDCNLDQYTNEIYYSNKQILDSHVDSYRNFNANNYLNIPAHAGRLQNLFILQNRFYAHTTDALWLLQYNNTAVSSDNGIIILGSGDLLNDPQMLNEGVLEGYAGIQHPKSAINSKWGYFFVDEEAKKLYRFGGEGLIEINSLDSGMYHFFLDKLLPCEYGCEENKYKIGVDYRYNRILFSNQEYTISYDIMRKRFVSFHDYIPEYFLFDRFKLYTIKSGKIYLHNIEGLYQTFYDKLYEFSIEFSAHQGDGNTLFPFIYESSILDVEAIREVDGNKVRNVPVVFDRMIASNSHQSTGELTIVQRDEHCETNLLQDITDKPGTIEFHHRDLAWNFNKVFNYAVDSQQPLFLESACKVKKEVNTDNINCSQNWDITTHIKDRYLIFKFIFSKFADVNLNVRSLFTRLKNTEEGQHG